MTMRYSPWFALRSPPRFSRCRLVLPGDASSGDAPQSMEKLDSERRRSGLSPAATSNAPTVFGGPARCLTR